jgi:hypothetical protein
MKRLFIVFLIFLMILLIPSLSHAQSSSVALRVSTLGAGLELERSFSDLIGGRIIANYFTYNYSGTEDDIKYNFDLILKSMGFLLDWHPFKGSFKISGGVIYSGNGLDAEARSATSYKIGDRTYSPDQIGKLTGEIELNDFAPYVGIGWDTSSGKEHALGFVFELGVVYQGAPDVDLSVTGPIANDITFQRDLAKEEGNLQDALNEFKFYPVVAIGISYRF